MHNKAASDSWLICYKPNPMARLRLFCLPYAGGSASVFCSWANALPSDVEIIGIEKPGLGTRTAESPINSVSSTVKELVDVIYPKLNKAFAFYGHCLGALVSFELTRGLNRQYGLEPVTLFVSGMGAPQTPNYSMPIHHLTDSAFLQELHRRHSQIPEEVLQSPEILHEMFPGLRADYRMYETYSYKNGDPLGCPITAFGGLQDNTVDREDLEAWRYQTKRTFTLHMVPGNHFFINFERQDFLPKLSDDLINTLTRVE